MIRVCEIFHSIQGESTHAGRPCTFIRLTGCNLRCTYCDTPYAYEEGNFRTIDELLDMAAQIGCPRVEITGGEPLLQQETPLLCERLLENGYEIWVETNGTINIDCLSLKIKRIVDIKCPGSMESDKTDWQNLTRLRHGDELKFVIRNAEDYSWAKGVLKNNPLPIQIPVLFSPVLRELPPRQIAEWILNDRLNVRLQIQLHKIIWPESDRGK
jgi:7-carboxy-7-deazaguanine synthase